MEESVRAFLEHINEAPVWIVYIFFFVSAVLQISFPPYPGDSVLIFGGYFAEIWQKGGGIGILVSYLLGTIACSMALYKLGEWKGESLLQKKLISRWFPLSSQDNARRWLSRYGTAALFLCKFVPGLNSLIIFFCGMFRYKKTMSYACIISASAVHNGIFFIVGRVIGQNWRRIGAFLTLYNRIVISLVILAILAYTGYKIWIGTKRKKVPDA